LSGVPVEKWVRAAKDALEIYKKSGAEQLGLYPDFVDKPFELADETTTLILTAPEGSIPGFPEVVALREAIAEINKICTDCDQAEDHFFWTDGGVLTSEYWESVRRIAAQTLDKLANLSNQ